MATGRRAAASLVALCLAVLGCSAPESDRAEPSAATVAEIGTATDAGTDAAGDAPTSAPATPSETSDERAAAPVSPRTTRRASSSSADPTPSPSPSPAPPERQPLEPASMTIPALELRDLRVVAYAGTADDAPGTEIQDKGDAASARGPDGGIGPGQVGNYIVTGHRTSHGAPFAELPSVRRGQHVLVTYDGRVYDYEITRTMKISFRSERSRASQSAPVPGRPGKKATRPMITLSTCATPEDHAAGNYWSDEFGNPEHRIVKVGVLVDTRPAG